MEEFKVEQPNLIATKKAEIEEALAAEASTHQTAEEQARPQDNVTEDATNNQAS